MSPSKSVMQAPDSTMKTWQLIFIRPQNSRYRESLMLRTASKDMMHEVKLEFDTLEEAEQFAKQHNYSYDIISPNPQRKTIKKSYADNFK